MSTEPPTTITRADVMAAFALLGIDPSQITSARVWFAPDHVDIATSCDVGRVRSDQSWAVAIVDPAAVAPVTDTTGV